MLYIIRRLSAPYALFMLPKFRPKTNFAHCGIEYAYGYLLHIYRVSQEERSIFWEVIVSVIRSINVYMNMCPIPNGFRDRAI